VTFTDPEVGSVGLTEATARERGIDVDVVVKSLPASFRGWLHGPGNDGVIKLIIDRAEGVLVGATSVGPHGGEVLGLLSVAMHERVPLERLRHMIYPYPTFHGAIGEALGAYGRGIGTVLDPGFQPLE
jgi:pyruvate/2-oxoglutarate dehydrogenase complex dihydrolipoamide dehydrogenase (E3) component